MSTISVSDFANTIDNYNIDLFICSSSFEERCLEIPLILPKIEYKLVFYNNNESNSIIKNSKKIASLLGDKTNLISLNSDQPINNFSKITNSFENFIPSNRKLNLFLDTTTFTHETLLILLRVIQINKLLFNKVIFGYVGASEYSYNSITDDEKWLSKGIKDIRTVLGYSGYSDPTKKNHLIVLFGFESFRTQKIIEFYEFEKVSLGFVQVDMAIQSNHHKINYERHTQLLDMFPIAEKFEFSLIDPLLTKKAILDLVEANSEYNSVVAPMNNKISTIGAGLAALENSDIQISYAKPLVYNSNAYSKSNGLVYYFEVALP